MRTLNLVVEVEYERISRKDSIAVVEDAVRRGVADELNRGIDNGFGTESNFSINRISVSLQK